MVSAFELLKLGMEGIAGSVIVQYLLRIFNGGGMSGYYAVDNSTGAGDARPQQPGRAFQLDGANDYINCGNHVEHQEQTTFSVGGFFYCTKLSNANQGMVSKSLNATDGFMFYLNGTDGARNIIWAVHVNGVLRQGSIVGQYNVNQWHHFFATFDSGIAKIYVDGVEVQSSDWTTHGTSITLSNRNLSIGNLYASSQPFGGRVSQVRFYDKALSQQEVEFLSSVGSSGVDPTLANLQGFWKLDDGAGDFAQDSSGNNKRGTLTNAVTADAHYTGSDVPGLNYQNLYGYTDGAIGYPEALQPRDETNPTHDVEGNPLDYTGRVPRNAKISNNFAANNAGSGNYTTFSGASGISGAYTFACRFKTLHSSVQAVGAGGLSIRCPQNVNTIGVWDGAALVNFGFSTSIGDLNTGVEHQLMVIKDDSNIVRCWIDGIESQTAGTAMTNTVSMNRINTWSSASNPFTGQVNDVWMFTRALSDSEREWIQTGGVSGTMPSMTNVVGVWPMQEGRGDMHYDVSGNDDHGSIQGGTYPDYWSERLDGAAYNLKYGFQRYEYGVVAAEKIFVPYRLDGSKINPVIPGYTLDVERPAGEFHNEAESQIDFSGGVASQFSVEHSLPTEYEHGDTLPGTMQKTVNNHEESDFRLQE